MCQAPVRCRVIQHRQPLFQRHRPCQMNQRRQQQKITINRTVWTRAWSHRTIQNRKQAAQKTKMDLNFGRHGFIARDIVIGPAQVRKQTHNFFTYLMIKISIVCHFHFVRRHFITEHDNFCE